MSVSNPNPHDAKGVVKNDKGVIARYREFLPVSEATPVVSLNEGSTPLIYSPRLSERAQGEVYVKYEGLNPTGSFKDRGMTMAISKAKEAGATAVICASTGNTSAAAAAYAARAGMKCFVLLPAGKIAMGKLAQAFMYGAEIIAIEGNFDDALRLVREIGAQSTVAIVNSVNPFRLEGQKTAAFEIVDDLGAAPDWHFLPVGNAGNITAYWLGYREFQKIGRAPVLPRMAGFQAEGAAPIFNNRVIEKPETVATAIRIGNPASWKGAANAISESNGFIDIVTDDEILAGQKWLAANEGIFVEPASAASIAGLFKALEGGRIQPESRIVCTVTGHGLKDPDVVMRHCPPIKQVPAEFSKIAALIG
ncbi:MAG TPA: threonine synthase [Chthoniobacterales bacterium]